MRQQRLACAPRAFTRSLRDTHFEADYERRNLSQYPATMLSGRVKTQLNPPTPQPLRMIAICETFGCQRQRGRD
jgi:hypothetical protein